MHPYLTRLGVRQEVQDFFEPFIRSDNNNKLLFDYGDAIEHFGMAFHRIPVSGNFWMAGSTNFSTIGHVIICSSAMEAIAFFHYNYYRLSQPGQLLFLSTGTLPGAEHFRWLRDNLAGKDFLLVFGDDLLGRIAALKTAAAIRALPLSASVFNELVIIGFRLKEFTIPADVFTLHVFEKLSGYRFKMKTAGTAKFGSYLAQLKAASFNQ
jgi:hypothetical protein